MGEEDFKSKSVDDRLWILFQLISKIDQHGCNWAGGRRHKESSLKRLTVLGVSIGVGFGFVFMAMKIIF